MYNKQLNITEIDITAQNDIHVLSDWRRSIEMQITEVLTTVEYNKQALSPNGKKLIGYLTLFRKLINIRIGEVKFASGYRSESSRRKDRALSMLFMNKAKELLDAETYNNILDAAKSAEVFASTHYEVKEIDSDTPSEEIF